MFKLKMPVLFITIHLVSLSFNFHVVLVLNGYNNYLLTQHYYELGLVCFKLDYICMQYPPQIHVALLTMDSAFCQNF